MSHAVSSQRPADEEKEMPCGAREAAQRVENHLLEEEALILPSAVRMRARSSSGEFPCGWSVSECRTNTMLAIGASLSSVLTSASP